MTASIEYKGDLRCVATHLQSGSIIDTDAPTDNQGKGERFSPTDLTCVSLATCIVTTMALKAKSMDIELLGTKTDVTKHMLSEPRRIAQIDVLVHFPAFLKPDEKDKLILERTGNNCPVTKSLHPELKVNIIYEWGKN